ncbi:MAG TPA: histidine phosphatase family protein [Tepidisphaeraceae bacterium]|jgi:broad specificity phosphatase PhoE|nr:histidine phosphatase family protein [Tepidisphaeraceae bacterium]
MRNLILIKHAKPLIDPQKSSELWRLSLEGREQAKSLASAIAAYQPTVILSSEEPKATETARILAKELNLPAKSTPDLHEHDRSNVPHMRSGEFISNVELFFRSPDRLVLGKETATQALARFEHALTQILTDHPEGNLALISHGTVIALFIEKHSDRNGFQIWREMSLPSFAVFDLPEMQLAELQARI